MKASHTTSLAWFGRAWRLGGGLILTALVTSFGASANGSRFYPDDPISKVVDSQDASGVKEREMDVVYDTLENSVYWPGDRTPNVRAQNVNTVDEVPDSHWFTNRIGSRPMTVDELLIGPDATKGPAPGAWTVVDAKNEGVTPGVVIRDSGDQLWFIKFDPPGYRGMSTGTEVVATKLFWALGYHVPEVHIASLNPDQLAIDDSATITPPSGNERNFKPGDITILLRRAHRDPDGTYRVVASKALEGRPVGGFRFYGTRPDDPNDIVPHEHRRELRAYGTFAAWLNHVDSKSINTLDTVIEQNGRQVVRHHLLDFGSTLGSAGVYPREAFEGSEHLIEGAETLAGIPTFGFYIKQWRTDPRYRARAVGAFPTENLRWDPEEWKARYHNSAFRAARMDDKFWAARRVHQFTNEMLTAVVGMGQFDDPESEQLLAKFLIDRRDAIVSRYLPAVNPVVDVQLSDGVLTFQNAAVDAGLAAAPGTYLIQWMSFDNVTGATSPIATTNATVTRAPTPGDLPTAPGSYIRVELSAEGGPQSWAAPAHAYFVREASSWKLIGFERVPTGNAPRTK